MLAFLIDGLILLLHYFFIFLFMKYSVTNIVSHITTTFNTLGEAKRVIENDRFGLYDYISLSK